jgi:oxygen-independent coproporphyrinogen-3 oxidase
MDNLSKEKWDPVEWIIQSRDFASYIFQYPPMAVWEAPKSDKDISRSWEKTLEINLEAGIYIHIPFCASKCTFCRWLVVEENSESRYWEYLRALAKEMALWSPLFKGRTISSLYLGGGTPSILSAEQILFLFDRLHHNFSFAKNAPVIFEANPSSLNQDKLNVLADVGVSRLTIGVQSLDDSVIKKVRRTQQNKSIEGVYLAARKAGIPYINLDLMCGLPGQNSQSFFKTLKRIIAWKPDMVHISPFSPTSYTIFSQQGEGLTLNEDIKIYEIAENAAIFLRQAGYQNIRYDAMGLSNEARNKHLEDTVVHGTPLLGLGAGAVSHATGQMRSVNIPGIKSYFATISQGLFPIFKVSHMTPQREMISWLTNNLWYGFFSIDEFKNKFPQGMSPHIRSALTSLVDRKILVPPSAGSNIWGVADRSPFRNHPHSPSRINIRNELFERPILKSLEKLALKARHNHDG